MTCIQAHTQDLLLLNQALYISIISSYLLIPGHRDVKVTCIDYNANNSLRVPHSAAPQEQVFTVESNPRFTRMLPVCTYKHKEMSFKCLVYHLQKQFTAYSHEASEPSQVIVGIFTLNATAVVFRNKFGSLKEDHIHKVFFTMFLCQTI